MTNRGDQPSVHPIFYRSRKPAYQAKIGTGPATVVVFNRRPTLSVGAHVLFYEVARQPRVPSWVVYSSGVIWKIEGNRLFINHL